MAVSVDTVYRTVLLILNKEQRGYLTPDEFNKIGTQVQLEMFNEYFEDLNQQLRIPENDSEYANRVQNIQEKLAYFKVTPKTLDYVPSGEEHFKLPSTENIIAQQSFTTIASTSLYYFTSISSEIVLSSSLTVYLNGVLAAENTDYQIDPSGFFINLLTIPSSVFPIEIEAFDSDFYKLGTVIYNDTRDVERIDRNNLLFVNRSKLTSPTKQNPVYVFEENRIFVYPNTITEKVKASYIKRPININWGFTSTPNNGFVFQASTSINFELAPTEQTALIVRILLYAGVIVKDYQMVQLASQQINVEKTNEKS
tara:strand:+ start:969 stop:1901 length:933 start_codon:yes stop_codon:yes gene_type:complete